MFTCRRTWEGIYGYANEKFLWSQMTSSKGYRASEPKASFRGWPHHGKNIERTPGYRNQSVDPHTQRICTFLLLPWCLDDLRIDWFSILKRVILQALLQTGSSSAVLVSTTGACIFFFLWNTKTSGLAIATSKLKFIETAFLDTVYLHKKKSIKSFRAQWKLACKLEGWCDFHPEVRTLLLGLRE